MTLKQIALRLGKVFARGILFFMTAAVILKLFLGQEWCATAIAFSACWIVGELIAYSFSKYDMPKSILLKVVIALIVFIVTAFLAGVINDSTEWLYWSRNEAGTYVISALISPLWQK